MGRQVTMIGFRHPELDEPREGHAYVVARLRKMESAPEQEPYFSLTSYHGADHATALRLHPELEPFAKLHLATEAGVPMHAIENGYYWLGFTRWTEYNPETFASLWRCTVLEAESIRKRVADVEAAFVREHADDEPEVSPAAVQAAGKRLLATIAAEEFTARWKKEADDALALLNALAPTAHRVEYDYVEER